MAKRFSEFKYDQKRKRQKLMKCQNDGINVIDDEERLEIGNRGINQEKIINLNETECMNELITNKLFNKPVIRNVTLLKKKIHIIRSNKNVNMKVNHDISHPRIFEEHNYFQKVQKINDINKLLPDSINVHSASLGSLSHSLNKFIINPTMKSLIPHSSKCLSTSISSRLQAYDQGIHKSEFSKNHFDLNTSHFKSRDRFSRHYYNKKKGNISSGEYTCFEQSKKNYDKIYQVSRTGIDKNYAHESEVNRLISKPVITSITTLNKRIRIIRSRDRANYTTVDLESRSQKRDQSHHIGKHVDALELPSKNPIHDYTDICQHLNSNTRTSQIKYSLTKHDIKHPYQKNNLEKVVKSLNAVKKNSESSSIQYFSKVSRKKNDSLINVGPYISTSLLSPLADHNYSHKNSTFIKHCDHTYSQGVISDRKNHASGSLQQDVQKIQVEEHYLGSMKILCKHCGAKHFRAEKVSGKGNSFNDCCNHGKVVLNRLPDPPLILEQLFSGTHELSNHFFERIRWYNNSFSFASFNANLAQFNNTRRAPFCFKIQGQIYYQINTSLYPANDEQPSFGQLFIVDSNEATEYRRSYNSDLMPQILQAIDNAMRQCNVFVHSYQTMQEEIDFMKQQNNGVEPELQLLFTLKKGQDERRYNAQRINEVAAIFSTTADGEIPQSYITIRNKRTKELQNVSSLDANVESWTYPLFYPHGSRGWGIGMPKSNSGRNVSRNDYIKYKMAIRDETNHILMGRRLFQQWTVDSYVKMEQDRTNWCRSNQTKIRADSYEGLMEHLHKRANGINGQVGKVIILPSSFIGSPRYMLQTYQDAMTIVRKFGKPDLFITMTCNPKWKEITETLLQGQTAADRPDLVARVFEQKKKELISVIVKDKFFGETQAYVHVVEYQKRGLPHVHLLVTLKHHAKIKTPEVVNKYISAEIPDESENPELHKMVVSHMIHGPCGNWCMNDKRTCSKKFPKAFCDETTIDEDDYPHYQRRNTGTFKRGEYEFDNRYVVPYNKELLLYFNCHINVEIVSSIKAVKYLYKYIYKGHDAATVTIQEVDNNETVIEHDEIRNYIETRYISAPEACGRILNYHLHNKSHSVMRLPIHLPNQQNVTILDINDEDRIRAAMDKQTELTDYFALNARDAEARQFTYAEIPSHYVFDKSNDQFAYAWRSRRAAFDTLGRMHAVSPTQIELFHLRLLLLSVRGATSFEDLRTVNGILHENFVTACLALGLIEDDNEWKNAMHEAEIWMMPRQLRQLLVRILIHCHPIHPEQLWEEFKDALSEDYSRTLTLHQAHRKAYIQINTLLSHENYSLASFPTMPQITEFDDTDDDILPAQHRIIDEAHYQKLNVQQKEIVDMILNRVSNANSNEPGCFFIDGPGGSGKTFIYITSYHLLRCEERKICTMAFTGIAATLLPHGKTVHKTFKLPLALYSDSSQTIKAQSKEADYLRSIDLFIWDEAPMAPRHALELVDRNLRDIMNNNKPFGGKIMLLGGDFRQLLPVKVNATRSELVNLSIKFSKLWPHFHQFALTQNMRTLPEEVSFAEFVLSVGDGTGNIHEDLYLPTGCIAPSNVDIAVDMYGEAIRNEKFDEIANWAILSARNVDVDEINSRVVELLDKSTEKVYTSINSVENCDNGEINEALLPEFLETLNPPNFPPHKLQLRVNAIVMLIRNLSINEGLCNGTRLRILELSNHLLKCEILTGDKRGQIVFINRITLYCDDKYPFTFSRRQFPIRLAFAMTINKAQGQTFDKIGIDLRQDVFNHGQLYVALSRVRSWNSLRVYLGQREQNRVKNYVFTELFI